MNGIFARSNDPNLRAEQMQRLFRISDRYTGNIERTRSFRNARRAYYDGGMTDRDGYRAAFNRRYSQSTYMRGALGSGK